MDKRTYHILHRQEEPLTMYSLRLMLKENDMEMYYSLCEQRLFDSGLVDDDDIQIDYIGDDVTFTAVGLWGAKEILTGYMPEDWLCEIYSDLKQINRSEREMNICFDRLRKTKTRIIKKYLRLDEPKKDEYHEAWLEFSSYLKLELKSRNIFRKIYYKVIYLKLNAKAKRISKLIFAKCIK